VPRDGSALSPMSVRYRGAHRGDHTSWEYVAYISIAREAHAGQPAWRESYRLQGLPPGPSLIIEGTTVVDPARWLQWCRRTCSAPRGPDSVMSRVA
jgi:hypothetical protein